MADKLEPRTIPAALVQSPLVKGKLRAERDDGRPTEDDIAKARLVRARRDYAPVAGCRVH